MHSTDIPKTCLDVFRMLPEGTRCEVLDNVMYMSPSPTTSHQRLLGILFLKLVKKEVKDKAEILQRVGTYFTNLQSAVQPDIIVVLNENADIIKPDAVYGAPDVVIEVLSEDKNRDTVQKKGIYERAGVKEYFVVEPDGLEATGFLLTDGRYRQHFTGTGLFKSTVLDTEFHFQYSA